MNARFAAAFACILTIAGAVPAGAQATIESFLPADPGIAVQRLGADGVEAPVEGMKLLPGDLLTASADGTFLELSCVRGQGRNSYRLRAPFRVLIDVPVDSTCHVNLLAGHTEVVAEMPTHTTAGGISLGSTGTQYSVDVSRTSGGTVLRCVVFDGEIRVLYRPGGATAAAGVNLLWQPDGRVERARNTARDVGEAAAIYARLDLAAAERQGSLTVPPEVALRQLTVLHAEVLGNPGDTAKRVALAKRQIEMKVTDQAGYNLRRVDVTSDAQLRSYRIDPAVVRRDLDIRAGGAAGDDAARVSAAGRRAAAAVAVATPTTETDLELIAAGRIDDAIAHLDARVARGTATARDYFALAKAYAARRDWDRLRAYASHALVAHASDGGLSAADLRELGELIARTE